MAKTRQQVAEERRFGRELSERERAAAAVGTDEWAAKELAEIDDSHLHGSPLDERDDPPPPPSAARPGVYSVRLRDYPRQVIATGLPAGPEAEAVARERYKAWLEVYRADLVPEVELV
jgi:hypothetical protein